jgi:hypothetical protein
VTDVEKSCDWLENRFSVCIVDADVHDRTVRVALLRNFVTESFKNGRAGALAHQLSGGARRFR